MVVKGGILSCLPVSLDLLPLDFIFFFLWGKKNHKDMGPNSIDCLDSLLIKSRRCWHLQIHLIRCDMASKLSLPSSMRQ